MIQIGQREQTYFSCYGVGGFEADAETAAWLFESYEDVWFFTNPGFLIRNYGRTGSGLQEGKNRSFTVSVNSKRMLYIREPVEVVCFSYSVLPWQREKAAKAEALFAQRFMELNSKIHGD